MGKPTRQSEPKACNRGLVKGQPGVGMWSRGRLHLVRVLGSRPDSADVYPGRQQVVPPVLRALPPWEVRSPQLLAPTWLMSVFGRVNQQMQNLCPYLSAFQIYKDLRNKQRLTITPASPLLEQIRPACSHGSHLQFCTRQLTNLLGGVKAMGPTCKVYSEFSGWFQERREDGETT